ncbi:MAG TPA: MFS transporter [Niabella sp.]|nr:MFS transporter [Chitinophagaceae bacterium]HRO83439.1 MFS transporter [Niabella sp.]
MTTTAGTNKNYTLPIIMMIILFGMISFVTGLGGPFGVIMKDQFKASDAMSQLGTFANFIAYAFMGIPSGLLLRKIGYKKTALLAIIVGFVGVAIQYMSGAAGSFAIYLAGAFVAGFSMCMLNAVVNPMLNTLGGEGKKGNQLIQVGGTFNSLNATIVPVLVGYLIGNTTSPTIKDASPALLIAMGIFALVFFVLYLVHIPEPHAEVDVAAKTGVKDKHSALSFRHFVLGAVGIFIYVGVEVGIPNFINLFMTQSTDKGGLGIGTTIAGSVVGTYWFLMLIGRLVGASIGAKVSSKAMLVFASGLGLVFVIAAILYPISSIVNMPVFKSEGGSLSFGMAEVPVSMMLLVLCGLCTSIMWGGIFNLAVEGLGKYIKMASGIFMVMVCGGGIVPWIQGQVSDIAGYIPSYWVIVVCMAYLLYYALVGSKNVNTDIPVGVMTTDDNISAGEDAKDVI